MKTNGFVWKLNDEERTMFISNNGVESGVKFIIINNCFNGIYSQAIPDADIVIPNETFIQLANQMKEVADELKKKQAKEKKFNSSFEEKKVEKKPTKKVSKKK